MSFPNIVFQESSKCWSILVDKQQSLVALLDWYSEYNFSTIRKKITTPKEAFFFYFFISASIYLEPIQSEVADYKIDPKNML